MTQPHVAPATTPDSTHKNRIVVLSVVIGTALEWFDMFLYASMAAVIFSPIFFPGADARVGAISALATFAVGYLARPVGALILGPMADRLGRKFALAVTFIIMGSSTALIGLIPDYATIGIWAPILLVALRLAQGLGAGAEQGTAFVTAFEHAAKQKQGLFGSLPALGVNIGLLASSLTVSAIMTLPEDILMSWGWRIPFVASGLLVFVGWYVRSQMPETPAFEKIEDEQPRSLSTWLSDLVAMSAKHWRGLLAVTLVTVGYNSITYLYKTFGLSYLVEFRGESASVGSLGIAIAAVFGIVMVPIAGRLADRFSVTATLVSGGCLAILFAFPYFWLLNSGSTALIWLALIIGTGFVAPTLFASFGAFLSRQFPPKVRSTGVSIREIPGSVAGGFVPVWALALVNIDGESTFGVSFLFIAAGLCVLAAVTADWNRRTYTNKEKV